MADFSAIKTEIQTNIDTNGNQEITGAVLQETLLGMVDATEDGISELGGKVYPSLTMIGEGTTIVYSFFTGLIPGNRYSLRLANPDVPLADTSGANYRFTINTYNDSIVTNILSISTSLPLSESYDFVMPDDGTSVIRVGVRCAVGEKFPISIVDITSKSGIYINKLGIESIFNMQYKKAAELRNGTAANVGNLYGVASTYIFPFGNNLKIYIETDRPLPSGKTYRFGYRTFSVDSGVSGDESAYAVTTVSATFGNTQDYIEKTSNSEIGFAFHINQFDVATQTREILRIEDFEGYNIFIVATIDKFAALQSKVDSIIIGDRTSILELNPRSEFLPKMMSAKKRYYTSSDTTKKKPITIAHLSDIHANWNNVARFIEWTKHYSSYIDILVNTGDTVADQWSDGISGYESLEGVENIINVIGNHDTMDRNVTPVNWQGKVGLPAYNMLIAPFVSSWGVVQPSGAAENGYCYFYKDFAENNLRIVFVDIMGYDSTEDSWLESVLSDALSLGYDVMIATHFAGSTDDGSKHAFNKVDCNYTTLYTVGGTSAQLNSYNTYAYNMMITVQSFISNGGGFVGYFQGHYHVDFVAKVGDYPEQLIYSIGGTKVGEMRDYNHIVGTRFQDEFQIISIDTYLKTVKLYKVGANVDLYGRHKNSVCVDYLTKTIKAEGF